MARCLGSIKQHRGSCELAWAVHSDGYGRHGERHVDGEPAQREGLHDQAAQALGKLRGGRHTRGCGAGRDTCAVRGRDGVRHSLSGHISKLADHHATLFVG